MKFGIICTLLELLYSGFALADCDPNHVVPIGEWRAADPSANPPEDHGITQSEGLIALSDHNVVVQKFVYDGLGPDARFWIGKTDVPDEKGKPTHGYRLPQLTGAFDIPFTLHDPLSSLKYFAVWDKVAAKAYALVTIPDSLQPPLVKDIGSFLEVQHDVKGSVTVADGRTFDISGFSFDGIVNATFMVGDTDKVEGGGTLIPYEENYTLNFDPLGKYDNQPVRTKLPSHKTVCDFKWLAVYSLGASESYGHVMIPEDLKVPADYNQNGYSWSTTTTLPTTRSTTKPVTRSPKTTKGPTAPGFCGRTDSSYALILVTITFIFICSKRSPTDD